MFYPSMQEIWPDLFATPAVRVVEVCALGPTDDLVHHRVCIPVSLALEKRYL